MVSLNKVMDAVLKFAEEEIFPGMKEIQEIVARGAAAWAFDSADVALNLLVENKVARAFGFIDGNRNIDAVRALKYLQAQIARKQMVTISVPLLGVFTFVPEDIDKIIAYVKEESCS